MYLAATCSPAVAFLWSALLPVLFIAAWDLAKEPDPDGWKNFV
jgi:hypothetical protein